MLTPLRTNPVQCQASNKYDNTTATTTSVGDRLASQHILQRLQHVERLLMIRDLGINERSQLRQLFNLTSTHSSLWSDLLLTQTIITVSHQSHECRISSLNSQLVD